MSEQPPIERDDANVPPLERDDAQQPDRHFGYIPDPNFTEKFNQQLKADDELQPLLNQERTAILADTSPIKVFTWVNRSAAWMIQVLQGQVKFGVAAARMYEDAGGTLSNARRIFQIVIDRYVQRKMDGIDIPGPDAWVKPWVREIVVRLLGEGFDEATGVVDGRFTGTSSK